MCSIEQVVSPLVLPNGVTLPNRLMMAPMCDFGADENGHVQAGQVAYFAARKDVAAMIVTGFAYVDNQGAVGPGQLSVASDECLAGLEKIAQAAQATGNKAILQISHSGREGQYAKMRGERIICPTALDFPWLPYETETMTEEEVENTIEHFGDATLRAIKAGFSGVEIHACNHDLIQQFFSAYSNLREDQWGGSLEKRMAYPLAVLDKMVAVIKEHAPKDFILGYRISPEEIHGENVGFKASEMAKLVAKVCERPIDYLNISLTSFTYRYDSTPENDPGETRTFPEIFRSVVPTEIPIYIGAQVTDAKEAAKALKHAEGAYIGRAALIDPEFGLKIATGHADEIVTVMTPERLHRVDLPAGLIATYEAPEGLGKSAPLNGL